MLMVIILNYLCLSGFHVYGMFQLLWLPKLPHNGLKTIIVYYLLQFLRIRNLDWIQEGWPGSPPHYLRPDQEDPELPSSVALVMGRLLRL